MRRPQADSFKPSLRRLLLPRWLFTPRGCALFYVPVRNQHLIRSTLPTSHGFMPRDAGAAAFNPLPPGNGKSTYIINFEFVGTMDNAPYFCVKDAIRWRRQVLGGEGSIREYCFELARRGAERIAGILGTTVLTNKSGTLQDCTLFNVRLPLSFDADGRLSGRPSNGTSQNSGRLQEHHDAATNGATDGPGDSSWTTIVPWMQEQMYHSHKTFIPVFWYKDALWARFSAQVYLELEDLEWGGSVLKELCEVVLEKGVEG